MGSGGAILTLNELVLPFGIIIMVYLFGQQKSWITVVQYTIYVCANFGENRSRNATVKLLADGQIH